MVVAMRALGVDVGERRLGLALSDPDGVTAYPLRTLRRQGWRRDLQALRELVQRHGVQLVVVGLPLRMDGTVGPAADFSRRFAERLRASLGVRVVLWDERLTTVQAERIVRALGLPPSRHREALDRVAAALILQSYLDHLRAKQQNPSGTQIP